MMLKYNPGFLEPNNLEAHLASRRPLVAGFAFGGRRVIGVSSYVSFSFIFLKKKNTRARLVFCFFLGA
jgi:hypothetical protein